MATQRANPEGQLLAWGGAVGIGVLVFVLLLVLGGWGIIQALWMAAVTVLAVGAFNYFVFVRPVPPLAGRLEPGGATRRAAAPADVPAAGAAAGAQAAKGGPAEPETPPADQGEARQ